MKNEQVIIALIIVLALFFSKCYSEAMKTQNSGIET